MKTLLFVLCLCAVSVRGQSVMRMPSLQAGGRFFEDVNVIATEPEVIVITHKGGVARVRYEDLPEDVRRALRDNESATKKAAAVERRIAEESKGAAEWAAATPEDRAPHAMSATVISQFPGGALVLRLPGKGRVYPPRAAYIAGLTGKKPGASWSGKVLMTGSVRFTDGQTYASYAVVR